MSFFGVWNYFWFISAHNGSSSILELSLQGYDQKCSTVLLKLHFKDIHFEISTQRVVNPCCHRDYDRIHLATHVCTSKAVDSNKVRQQIAVLSQGNIALQI